MAVRDIVLYPDERLKAECAPVEVFDEALAELARDLEDTRQVGPGAVGIAAPQIGVLQRVCIVDCSTTRKPTPNNGHLVLVNPEVLEWEGLVSGREGCLSIPDYTGNVVRAEKVRVRSQTVVGETFEIESEGFEARAIQHEIDHLDGILFLDRLVSRRTDLFRRKVYQKGGKKRPAESKKTG